MANANYATDGLLGAKLLVTSTTQLFTLGHNCIGNGGSRWVYVKASGAVTGAGYTCVVDEVTWLASMITTTNGLKGMRVAVPGVAFADADYGWMQFDGYCSAIRVNANCAANAKLNTTATGGLLDDDATGGTKQIDVITVTTATSGSAAVEPGNITCAVVGATL